MAAGTRSRLNRQAWSQAALEAIATGGLAAVAVVPLAKQLGATKGSFYWHFPNREALITAALADWEQSHTAAVIAEIEAVSDDPLRQPSETRHFEKGRFDIYRVGPATLGRAAYEPGWRWSEHVAPVAGSHRRRALRLAPHPRQRRLRGARRIDASTLLECGYSAENLTDQPSSADRHKYILSRVYRKKDS
jgi:AcrR family transcriptional regulator